MQTDEMKGDVNNKGSAPVNLGCGSVRLSDDVVGTEVSLALAPILNGRCAETEDKLFLVAYLEPIAILEDDIEHEMCDLFEFRRAT